MLTSLPDAALVGLVKLQMRLNPVVSDPVQPPGIATGRLNTLWGYGLWIFAAIAAFALLAALIVAMFNHQQGRPNEGFGKVAVILGACIATGLIGGTIGAITGT